MDVPEDRDPDIEPGWDMGWFLWPVALWIRVKHRIKRFLHK